MRTTVRAKMGAKTSATASATLRGAAAVALGLAVLSASPLLRADESGDDSYFQNIFTAFKYWLKEDPLLPTEMTVSHAFRNYKKLNAMALDRLLTDPAGQWKVHKIRNYDFLGREAPVDYAELPMSSRGDVKDVVVGGYYFAYKGDVATGPRLILRPSSDYEYFVSDGYFMIHDTVEVYYAKRDEAAAAELQRELDAQLNERNMFRGSVVEFLTDDSSPSFKQFTLTFMPNVADFKLDWQDLILPPELRTQSYESTEGFIAQYDRFKELGAKQKKGLLLYGPPGNGKSLLAQVMISSMNQGALKGKVTMFVVTARHLSFRHAVKALFEEAARLSPSVIFIEDIDLLGIKAREREEKGDKGGGSAVNAELLNEFLNHLDGVVDQTGLLVVGTTNKPEAIDEALARAGRLGTHIYYSNPAFPERKEFFLKLGMRKAVWAPDVGVEWLAGDTEGLSGADIVEIISLAKEAALLAGSFEAGKLLLNRAHFEGAIERVKRDHSREPFEARDLPMELRRLQELELAF